LLAVGGVLFCTKAERSRVGLTSAPWYNNTIIFVSVLGRQSEIDAGFRRKRSSDGVARRDQTPETPGQVSQRRQTFARKTGRLRG